MLASAHAPASCPFKVARCVSRWGDYDLPSLLSEQAEALDRPLDEIARKFTTVEVPRSDLGWRWQPWLGFIKNR
jgi:CRISPR-associated endonuclease/helicase Cas3